MQLKGKNILFLGSSVTYGYASDGISFTDIMAEQCGFNCIKEAVSGTTLADIGENSYVSRLKRLANLPKIDLFVCQLSTNDATRKIPILKIEEAIRFIVSYAKSKFECQIVFYTNTYYEDEAYFEMVELLKKLANELGFFIINLYDDSDMRSVTQADHTLYMKDKIHPTLKGYKEWWTPKFIDFLETFLP